MYHSRRKELCDLYFVLPVVVVSGEKANGHNEGKIGMAVWGQVWVGVVFVSVVLPFSGREQGHFFNAQMGEDQIRAKYLHRYLSQFVVSQHPKTFAKRLEASEEPAVL